MKNILSLTVTYIKNKIKHMIKMNKHNNLIKRCCHFKELYITHDGTIYPCCLVLNRKDMRIAHIRDDNLIHKINSFSSQCYCSSYKFRKALSSEVPLYEYFTIEFALHCQANCAMCGVHAPSWKGKYDFYRDLDSLINKYKPKSLVVQGGEVLIQKEALQWIHKKKNENPSLFIQLITNCNVDIKMIDTIENIFDLLHISVVGFQPETYKRIMCLNIENLKTIITKIINRKNIKVTLKYLITPINIHEVPLFLKWCIELSPENCLVCDASTAQYIKMDTIDNYWNKIISRTADALKEILLKYNTNRSGNNIHFEFDSNTIKMFKMDDIFMRQNNLNQHKKY